MDVSLYKKEKVLKKGGKSESVFLLKKIWQGLGPRYVIRKKYNKTVPKHRIHFDNEIKILEHLKECPFVPKILQIDRKLGIIYMTYCGRSVERFADGIENEDINNDENRIQDCIRELMKELGKDWNVIRETEDGNPTYEIGFHNVCIRDNKVYLIDFGSPLWKIKIN